MARRVQFGTTWWGKQWIDALTHLDYENRLPRGRTYYNTGRIDDMQFNPAKLRVEAIAHGSAYSPYEVAIDLKPLPSAVIRAVCPSCIFSAIVPIMLFALILFSSTLT